MNSTVPLDTFVLGPEHNGIRMTPDEFDAITAWKELYDYELIRGVLVVNPPPLPEERGPNEYLGYLLLRYREDHPQGSSLDDTLAEHTVRTADSRRRADRVIWTGLGRPPEPIRDIPNIIIEFVSAGRRDWKRDYIEKRDEYLALGIAEYWVLDRFQRTMTVFRKRADSFDEKVVQEDKVYCTDFLPGFELPVGRLFEVADRWSTK